MSNWKKRRGKRGRRTGMGSVMEVEESGHFDETQGVGTGGRRDSHMNWGGCTGGVKTGGKV